MDTAISGGDFELGANGRPRTAEGAEELFQRALIRLTVPLGAFPCNPALGSRLHTLKAGTPLADEKAFSLAREALRSLPQLAVTGAKFFAGDEPSVRVTVSYGGESRELEVKL